MAMMDNSLPEPIRDHGGDLRAAMARFPHAPRPWLDLSTGINPVPYPFAPPPASAWTRLPAAGDEEALLAAAARGYGAPSPETVVAAPGTQILLPLVMGLVASGRAAVLSPTYAEHARAARLAGHAVSEPAEFGALAEADLAVVVNPNNPDGRVTPRSALLDLARHMRRKGGLLVVDEAFMDVGPQAEALDADVTEGGIVVLRSFGKFFGLAGLRLGFALAEPSIAALLRARLGPWAVSGPALHIGAQALDDRAWQARMRAELERQRDGLDRVLGDAGLQILGGTSLFRYTSVPDASVVFEALARRGVLTRRFAFRGDRLRIGLLGNDSDRLRLADALKELAQPARDLAAHARRPPDQRV